MKLTTSILRIQTIFLAALMACSAAYAEAVEFETLAPVQLNTTLTPTLTDATPVAVTPSAPSELAFTSPAPIPEPKYQLT